MLPCTARIYPGPSTAEHSTYSTAYLTLWIFPSAARVSGPACMALYQCCRADATRSRQLCLRGGARESGSYEIWAALLDQVLDPEPVPVQGPPGGQRGGRTPVAAPASGVDEWLPLLVSCVALRQGMLGSLMEALRTPVQPVPSAQDQADDSVAAGGGGRMEPPWQNVSLATVSSPEEGKEDFVAALRMGSSVSDDYAASWRWSRHHPTLLHLLAHEVEIMKDASPVGLPEDAPEPAGCSVSEQQDPPAWPWQRALSCVVAVMRASAEGCCQDLQVEAAAAGAGTGTGTGSSQQGILSEAVAIPPATSPEGGLSAHVLEAAFEVGPVGRVCVLGGGSGASVWAGAGAAHTWVGGTWVTSRAVSVTLPHYETHFGSSRNKTKFIKLNATSCWGPSRS